MCKNNKMTTAWFFLLSIFLIGVAWYGKVSAANFTEASMRLNRMKKSITDNQILVVVKPATVATEGKIVVTFSSGFSVDSTPANITASVTGLPSTYQGETLTAWPTIGATASAVSDKTVTFSSGDLSVGTLYGFYITAGVDNPSSAGSSLSQTIATQTAAGASIDSSDVAVAILDDDQVVITASVPPILTFALGANSDTFATDLSTSSIVSTSGVSVTVGTNAQSGWIAWLKSANTSLDSATTLETIETSGSVDDACTTLSNGSDFYQLDVNLTSDSGTGDGTVTVASEYDCGASAGGTYSADFQQIASGSGTTAGDIVTLVAKATISAVKAAATNYTDTWTVVGAGNF